MKKILFSMLAAACLSSAAPDPNFHIYIAYGQSNMGGTAEAQSADKVEKSNFKIFASQVCSQKGRTTLGAVYPAVPSLFNCGNTISVADWFGRTLADSLPDVTIGIIPVAVGGASIKLFDKDQYSSYLSTAESWLQNYAKEYDKDGNVPKAILDLAKKAQEVGVIKGIIFHQGETDGGYSDWPKIVKKTRDDILSALNLSADTVPFVAGELLRTGCCYSDRVSKLPNTMENTYFASSEGLEGNGQDRFHFGHDSYVVLGKRYAEQMLKAINRAPVVPVPQEPFGSISAGTAVAGDPAPIPGKIEFENYDINGVGTGNTSYRDEDSENKGKEYRNDGVDIEKAGDNFAVGYTMAGEWMEYTVDVKKEDNYAINANLASGSETSSFKLYLDDKPLLDEIKVPKTGDDWTTYKIVDLGEAKLSSGKHVLKVEITGSYVNLDWISFKSATTTPDYAGSLYNINFIANGANTYHVFGMNGKFIGNIDVTGNSLEANLKSAGYKNGVYVLQNSSTNAKRTVKVSK